jgi:hypothetical protein
VGREGVTTVACYHGVASLSLSLSLFQVYFNASLFDFRCGFAIKAKAKTKTFFNGTARFKNVNNCSNTNIYSYLETLGSQSHNLCLNVVHFFNTGVN